RLADRRPMLLQEGVVRRDEVLAVGLQDRPRLPVGGVGDVGFAAEADEAAVGLEAGAEILHGAHRLLELGEKARHRLLVVPDVRAGTGAAADAFPRPEAPVLPPLAG